MARACQQRRLNQSALDKELLREKAKENKKKAAHIKALRKERTCDALGLQNKLLAIKVAREQLALRREREWDRREQLSWDRAELWRLAWDAAGERQEVKLAKKAEQKEEGYATSTSDEGWGARWQGPGAVARATAKAQLAKAKAEAESDAEAAAKAESVFLAEA